MNASTADRWTRLWRQVNVRIDGDDRADRAVRHNLYTLLIAAPRSAAQAEIVDRAARIFQTPADAGRRGGATA